MFDLCKYNSLFLVIIKKINCRHDKISIQEYNKKINEFIKPYDIFYFLLDYLSQIKYTYWPCCFGSDYENRKC